MALMFDGFATVILTLVVFLLVIGVRQQFVLLAARGALLDQFAIVPQWKFFGLTSIASDPAVFDDLHLLVRVSPNAARSGEWRELHYWGERRLLQAVWNPSQRSKSQVALHMLRLALAERHIEHRAKPTALSYLTVLRYCLATSEPAAGVAIQFAIVMTRGRGEREVALRFLSAWHKP